MKHLFARTALLLALCTAPAFAEDAPEQAAKPAAKAVADIVNDKNESIGEAIFVQGPIGVLATIKVKDLPPGAHGMHIHAMGMCDHGDHFKSASGHVNPDGKEHGYLNEKGPEKGDLPNLMVGADGTASLDLFLPQFNVSGDGNILLDDDGSALMIHESPDDYTTQPIGGSGARIACGVLKTGE